MSYLACESLRSLATLSLLGIDLRAVVKGFFPQFKFEGIKPEPLGERQAVIGDFPFPDQSPDAPL